MSRRTHSPFIMGAMHARRASSILPEPIRRREEAFSCPRSSILEPPREPTERAAWRLVDENGINNTGAEDTGASNLKPENKAT